MRGIVGGGGVDLGQRQPLDDDSRHEFRWSFATAWVTARPATAFSWKTEPRSTTFWTATWRCKRARHRRCRARSCRSTGTKGRASGGPIAATLSCVTSPSNAINMAFATRRRRFRALMGFCRFAAPTTSRRPVDIRTLPFLRFEENEAHTQRRYGLNLGGGPGDGAGRRRGRGRPRQRGTRL